MRYRPLGQTSIKVSEVGFGCWTMGGPNWSTSNGQSIGWADVNDDDVLAGVKVALEAGVNHWDNADIYGNGRAERTLATCLRKCGALTGKAREGQVIATKVGHFKGTCPNAYDPFHIRHQCEQSLRNLQVECIDLYYFHHGTFVGQGYDGRQHDYLHEAVATMHALRKEGKVRAIGQSAYTDEDFERIVPILKPDVLQNKANLRYDPFIRPGSRCQALMQKYGCTFVAFGPLDQGILLDKFDPERPPKFEEGDYRTGRKDFNPDTLRLVRAKLGTCKQRFGRGDEGGATAMFASMAIRWVLGHDRVCSAIPGFRNGVQATCNVVAGRDSPMSADDIAWLRDLFACG